MMPRFKCKPFRVSLNCERSILTIDHRAYKRGDFSALAKKVNDPGAMMAVGCTEAAIAPKLRALKKGRCKIACVNSPESLTISGDAPAIQELQEMLQDEGIFNRVLKVDTAYHSHHMETIAAEYRQSLQDIPTGKPKSGVTFYSSVTASVKTNGFGAAYWTENLVSKVRFSDALQRLSRDSASISSRDAIHAIVEIGPHSALQGPIRQTLSAENNGIKVTYVPTLVRGQDATRTVLATAGRLFENAWPVNWQAVVCANSLNGGPRTLSNLPAYPWDHDTKYWWESRLSSEHRFRQFPNHDLLGLFDVNSNIYEPRWRYHVNVGEIPWLKHHVVDDAIVFPGAGYICMAIEAIKQLVQLRNPTEETPISRFVVKNATFLKPIMLKDPEDQGVMDPTVEIQLVMTRDTTSESSTWETFRVLSWDRVDRTWNENCKGQIRAEYASRPDEVEGTREEEMSRHERLSLLEHIKASSTEEIEVAKFYKDILAGGNYYGPTFAPFTSIHVGSKGTKFGHGCIEIPNVRKYMPAEFLQPHVIHPSTLDAISHIGVHLFKRECTNSPLMLVYLGEMVVSADIVSAPAEQLQVAVQIRPQGHSFASGDTFAFQRDEPSGDLTLVCSLTNFHMRAIGDSVQDSSQTPFNRRMNYRMAWKEDIDFATNDSFANRPECLENPTEDTAEPGILVDSGLVALVSTLAFKQPRMKILELGVEEASPDRHILKSMHAYGNRMFSEYHYAVPGTLSKKEADTLLGTWKHTVELKTLDLADSTLPQEFEKAHYDLIIASNVTDLSLLFEDAALSRLRRLLNDGGRVFFPGIEGAERKSEFDLALRMNGFTGVEPLTQDSTPSTSILVSRAVGPSKDVQASLNTQWNVQILHDDPNSQHLWDTLASSMSEAGAKCNFSLWNATADIDMETPCIVLDNAAKPLLESPSEAGFEAIKSLLLNSRKLLWISYHQRDDVLNDARKGLVTGMARVARRENAGVSFITLDVRDEIGTQIPDHLMKTIATFASKCLGPNDDRSDTNETEYALSNGRVLIPRVYPDAEFNHWNDLLNHTAPHGECSFQDMLHPLKVVAQTPGLLNSLAFVRDPAPLQELGPDEIQLEAKAYGVNFRDVFIALGQMPDGLPMAGEVAGVVTAVGSEAKSLYKVGDEVVGIGGQPFSSHPRLKALRARKIPAGISLVDASSIPLVYLTAYYGLVELARLESGQTVLIHAASGGVGQAAIQIAKHIGATIFATVGGSEKRALIMEKYGIPESHIFSSRAKSFKQGIMRLTNNRGVDVVLNSLAGEMLTESWECIAPMGTHIEIGKADIYKKSHLSMVPFDKNVTFTSIDLLVLFDERPQKMHTIFGKVLDMLAQGFFSPVFPFKIFAIHQIEQAFRMIAERKHTGKVILEVGDGATVTGELPIPTALRLDPNGTYIVAGGLGDLGRRLCTLLARRGAGNIVTLSRRVLDEEIKSQFSREIAELGATLYTAQCNIVDRLAVEKVKVDLEEKGLSPVRGIIHAGMVLRVSV